MYALKTKKVPGFNHLLATNGFAYAKTDRKIIREAIAWADVVHMMMNFPMEKACTEICIEMHKPMTTAFHVQMENITSQISTHQQIPAMWPGIGYELGVWISLNHRPSVFANT